MLQAFGIIQSLLPKGGRGNENTLVSAKTAKTPDKALHVWTLNDRARTISIGLNVDPIKAQSVFVDDTLNTALTASAQLPCRIFLRAAVTHCCE